MEMARLTLRWIGWPQVVCEDSAPDNFCMTLQKTERDSPRRSFCIFGLALLIDDELSRKLPLAEIR